MPSFIFLSYSRLDAWQARAIAAELRYAGFNLWIDTGLEPGTPDWSVALEGALVDCACVVCLCSPNAKISEWVAKELALASSNGKPIYPVWASGDSEVDAIPESLRKVQAVDLRYEYQYSLSRLIAQLHKNHDEANDFDLQRLQSSGTINVLRSGSLFWYASEVRKLRLLLVPESFSKNRLLQSLAQMAHHATRLCVDNYTSRDIEHIRNAVERLPADPATQDRVAIEMRLRQIQDNVAVAAERLEKNFQGGPFSGAPINLHDVAPTTPDEGEA